MAIVPKVLLVVALFAAAGCAKKSVSAAGADAPIADQGKAGAFLAYEHTVRIGLDADAVAKQVDAVREACASERYGACSLLSAQVDSGTRIGGEVAVRIVPAGVEPLVKLAAEGGAIRSSATRAEDLAQPIADNERQRSLLSHQRAKLEEFQSRKELAVADMLALARELAALETQIDAAEQESAQQQRRLETNHLTIQFLADNASTQESRVVASMKNLWASFNDGLADAVEYAGYLLPFVLLGFPLLLLLRWLWRRATRPRRTPSVSSDGSVG